MPLVKTDIPQLLLPSIKATFFEEYDKLTSQWQKVATEVPSTSDSETYAWLGAVPSVREFIDERQIKAMSQYTYSIKNKTWESTLGVERAAIEDDKWGQIKIRIQGLARACVKHQESLVFGMFLNGFTTTCYSGDYFFADTHTDASPTSAGDNKNTAALTALNLQAAITQMRKFTNDVGDPLDVVPDTLIVPPDLEWTAREILNSAYNADATSAHQYSQFASNQLQGALDLIVSPYVMDTAGAPASANSNWYLACTKGPVKPIILQNRMGIEFTALEATSENGFMRDMYAYGIRARYNVGFGPWQMAVGSIQ